MAELIITRGAPGSGKSTWAKQRSHWDGERHAIVNRDELRQTMFNKDAPLPYAFEEAVTVAQRAAVEANLREGVSVIVDDCHVSLKYVKAWAALAAKCGAGFTVVEHFREVPVDECVDRDAERGYEGGRYVGSDVVREMHARLLNSPKWDPAAHATAAPEAYTYEPNQDKPLAWLVDVDGTLALMDGRGPYDFDRVGEDKPNTPVVTLARLLRDTGYEIIILSGRDDSCYEETATWLRAHGISFKRLLMRESGDRRKDSEVKLQIFRELVAPHHNVVGVLDDRDQVVEMWRSIGLFCAQVAPGAF